MEKMPRIPKVRKVFYKGLGEFLRSPGFKLMEDMPSLIRYAAVFPWRRLDDTLWIECSKGKITRGWRRGGRKVDAEWITENVDISPIIRVYMRSSCSITSSRSVVEASLLKVEAPGEGGKPWRMFVEQLHPINPSDTGSGDKVLLDVYSSLTSCLVIEGLFTQENIHVATLRPALPGNEFYYTYPIINPLIRSDIESMVYRYTSRYYLDGTNGLGATHVRIKHTCFGGILATALKAKDTIMAEAVSTEHYIRLEKATGEGDCTDDSPDPVRIKGTRYCVHAMDAVRSSGKKVQVVINPFMHHPSTDLPRKGDRIAFRTSPHLPSGMVIFNHVVKREEEIRKSIRIMDYNACPSCGKRLDMSGMDDVYMTGSPSIMHYIPGPLRYDLVPRITCPNIYCDTRKMDRATELLRKTGVKIGKDNLTRMVESRRYRNPIDLLSLRFIRSFKGVPNDESHLIQRSVREYLSTHTQEDVFIDSLPVKSKSLIGKIRRVLRMLMLEDIFTRKWGDEQLKKLLHDLYVSDENIRRITTFVDVHRIKVRQVWYNPFDKLFTSPTGQKIVRPRIRIGPLSGLKVKVCLHRDRRTPEIEESVNMLSINGAEVYMHDRVWFSDLDLQSFVWNTQADCLLVLDERLEAKRAIPIPIYRSVEEIMTKFGCATQGVM